MFKFSGRKLALSLTVVSMSVLAAGCLPDDSELTRKQVGGASTGTTTSSGGERSGGATDPGGGSGGSADGGGGGSRSEGGGTPQNGGGNQPGGSGGGSAPPPGYLDQLRAELADHAYVTTGFLSNSSSDAFLNSQSKLLLCNSGLFSLQEFMSFSGGGGDGQAYDYYSSGRWDVTFDGAQLLLNLRSEFTNKPEGLQPVAIVLASDASGALLMNGRAAEIRNEIDGQPVNGLCPELQRYLPVHRLRQAVNRKRLDWDFSENGQAFHTLLLLCEENRFVVQQTSAASQFVGLGAWSIELSPDGRTVIRLLIDRSTPPLEASVTVDFVATLDAAGNLDFFGIPVQIRDAARACDDMIW
jgi:hypothetical protein